MCDRIDQFLLVLDRGQAVELRFERCETFGVHRFFVHAGAEIIADLLVNGFASTFLRRRLLQNVALNGQVALVDFREANPPRLVGGDLSVLQPVAAGVLIKINARIGSLINVGNAEAGRRRGRRLSETGDG